MTRLLLSARTYARAVLTFVGLSLALAACGTTETLNRASTFANAGIEFTDKVPAFYDQAFDLAVIAGSISLEKNRARLPRDNRIEALKQQDTLLQERYQTLTALKQHALFLRSYFIALKGLVDSDDAQGITDATKGIVGKIGKIEPAVKDLKILGAPVESAISPAVTMIVGAYKASALRREFTERGPAIERELALHNAAFALLRDQIKSDLDLQIEVDERRPIEDAYIGPVGNPATTLPGNWRQQRIAMFRRSAAIPAADNATKASETLHQSWISLVRGTADGPTLAILVKDIEEFVSLVEAARAKQ